MADDKNKKGQGGSETPKRRRHLKESTRDWKVLKTPRKPTKDPKKEK